MRREPMSYLRHVGFIAMVVSFALAFSVESARAAWSLEEAAKPYKGQTINFIGEDTDSVTACKTVASKEFIDRTGINVNFTFAAHPTDEQKVYLDFSAGTQIYDVWNMDYVQKAKAVEAGWLTPLKEFWAEHPQLLDPNFDLGDFVGTEDAGIYEGKLYGIPMDNVLMFYVYNKKRLDDAGFAVPKTWEEFTAISKHFTDKANGRYGLATGLGRSPEVGWEFMAYLFNFGGKPLDEKGHPSLDTQEAKAALTYWVQQAKLYAPPGAIEWTAYDVFDGFTSGVCTHGIFWNDSVDIYYDDPKKSKVVGEMAYALPPGLGISHEGNSALMIPRSSKRKEAAWLFIQFALSKKFTSVPTYAPPYCPTRRSYYENPEVMKSDRYKRYLHAFIEARDKAVYPRPILPQWNAMQESLIRNLNACHAGMVDVETTLKRTQREWNVIMGLPPDS